MKTQVKALTSFTHGRIHLHAGETSTEFTKGDAEDLQKAGMVEIVGAAAASEPAQPLLVDTPAAAPNDSEPAQENVSDILGETKMDDQVENKMDEEPANKGGRKTHKKAD